MKERTRETLTAYTFLAPLIVFVLIFFGYAFARTLYFSFTNYNLFVPPTFKGIDNYAQIITEPRFGIALVNTLVYCLVVTTLQTIGALLMAIVLNQKLSGRGFFRTAFYLPSITSSVVITLIFIWLFQPRGVVAYFINILANHGGPIFAFVIITALAQAFQVWFERRQGLPAGPFDPALLVVSLLVGLVGAWGLTAFGVVRVTDAPPQLFDWLTRQDRVGGVVSYPLLFIIIQNTFTTIPTLMLFFLAGLQGVPQSLYEAASIDGTTPAQKLRYITVPMLRPVTFYVVTTGVIGTLQLFDQVSLLQGTAPLESVISLAYYVYNNVFSPGGEARVGLASAAALILAAITLSVVMIQRRFVVNDEGYS